MVTAGSQKITLWGPQRTPLGILRVNKVYPHAIIYLIVSVHRLVRIQHGQCTYNVTLGHVRTTITAVEKVVLHILSVCL